MTSFLRYLFPIRAARSVFVELYQTMESLILAKGNMGLVLMLVSLIVFWHLYTPIHELLHVLGVVLTGGEVGSLALKPQYGGLILANIFDFVVPESEYAGQLVDFQVPCDLAYYLVDVLPYSLSLFGCFAAVLAKRFQSPMIFGVAVILSLIPLLSLPGDFYEASSLMVTYLFPLSDSFEPRLLVHDDLIKLIGLLIDSGQMSSAILLRLVLGVCLGLWQILLLFGLQWWLCLWAKAKFEAISVPG